MSRLESMLKKSFTPLQKRLWDEMKKVKNRVRLEKNNNKEMLYGMTNVGGPSCSKFDPESKFTHIYTVRFNLWSV